MFHSVSDTVNDCAGQDAVICSASVSEFCASEGAPKRTSPVEWRMTATIAKMARIRINLINLPDFSVFSSYMVVYRIY